MCFHQLPIEFDDQGRPVLKDGGWAGATPPRGPSAPPPAPNVPVKPFHVAPVTRIAGAMDFRAEIDLAGRRVYDARASAAAFRGYELVLRGRAPTEAMDISSRACGVCGGVHSTAASMGLDMALPVKPPPLGIVTRNIAQAAELLYDHTLHLCLLAGPDYSRMVVERHERTLWALAERTPAPHSALHGKATIAEVMKSLDPLTGELYVETFSRMRVGMEMVAVMVGNYPHPKTLIPGGIRVMHDAAAFRRVLDLLNGLVDYVKRLIGVYEDLMTFYEQARPLSVHNGERPANLLCFGRYDDVDQYDGTYARIDDWAGARAIAPGVILDGKVRTTSLRAINLGIEEFVDHSFYEQWSGHAVPNDPSGGPLSPFHPWNKQTVPRPEARDWKERYTWSTAPRWDREVVECGPIARNWMLAVAGKPWGDRVAPDGGAVEYVLPAGPSLPETRFVWRVPGRLNTIERNRARAHHLGITWQRIAFDCEVALQLLAKGERQVWAPHTVPQEGIGTGLWEAARGALGHWTTLAGGVVDNYQIVTPSSFNASPRDPWGRPGPYEEAAIATPILEEFDREEDFAGIDLMRAIRSFDPCMPCAVHMHAGDVHRTRDVVSCGCGL